MTTRDKGISSSEDPSMTPRADAEAPAKKWQCHQCGRDFAGEPFKGEIRERNQVKYPFFCSVECRYKWATTYSVAGSIAQPSSDAEALVKEKLALELALALKWWGFYDWPRMIEKVKKLKAAEATLHALQEQRTPDLREWVQHTAACEKGQRVWRDTDWVTATGVKKACTCDLDAALAVPSKEKPQSFGSMDTRDGFGFAGLASEHHDFAGVPEQLQPSNLPSSQEKP
jgi:hypothetical protein